MFGYIIINKGEMKFREFDVYHSYYCGLCQTLKDKYGLAGQAALTYDMTFLVMLLTSLYEPEIMEEKRSCLIHPFEKHLIRRSSYTEYGADMNVLFAEYKCQDDWTDDRKLWKLAYGKLLKGACRKAESDNQEKIRRIDNLMHKLSIEEKKNNQNIDEMAGIFGEIMGEIFAVRKDEWEESLRIIGTYLGKYIYLLDAYEDIEKDAVSGNYNPFMTIKDPENFDSECQNMLMMQMAECCRAFERLPIVQDAGILRNILYSGVWAKFASVYNKRNKAGENE